METYKKHGFRQTSLNKNESIEGVSIEKQIQGMLNNGEPITDPTVATIYTERKDGVLPQFNIRTDKFETAQEALRVAGSIHVNAREKRIKEREEGNIQIKPTEEIRD